MGSYSNPLTEYSPQMETAELLPEGEFEDVPPFSVFSREEEMRLAAELLDVHNEPELEGFLGDLIRKAAGALGKFASSAVGKSIGAVLKKAIPLAGGAIGGMVGGPLGARIGGALASQAGQAFGLELEGLSPEDREFEAAKRFVRIAGATAAGALEALKDGDPPSAAYRAAMDAAREFAPGLMNCSSDISRKIRRKRMHDIDRTQVGFGYEAENPSAYESAASSIDETEQMELAAELMEVSSEEEFESLLGTLLSRAVKAAGGYLGSPSGKALAGVLKGAARQILPVVQQVADNGEYEEEGGYESEAEMEDQEWEAAQTFVKLAQEAAANLAQAPPDSDPTAAAHQAVADAAQTHAPNLLAGAGQPQHPPAGGTARGRSGHCGCAHGKGKQGGRWVRRGNQIVVYGV